jgi:CAAX prenyl protease-like protein
MNTDKDMRPTWAHVLPFAAWLVLMAILGEPAAWKYAIRVVVAGGLFIALKPWTTYQPPRLAHVPLALGAGVLVFALWVLPESGALPEALRTAWLKWAVMPLGRLPEAAAAKVYAPDVCGWPLTIVRLLGSALVIAVVEEFFWRGWLYRWLLGRDFLQVDLGRVHVGFVLLVSLVFGFEHHRWLAGFIAGLVFAGIVLRTRNIWAACLAHACANLLLGLYVLRTGSWAFW